MQRKPDRRVFWLLERASAGVRQRVERLALEHLDTTAAQLPVIFYLAGKEGARPGELAEALGVNAAAITGLTGRMEDAGVLRRKPAPDDGRAQVLSLTAAGKRIAARALPAVTSLQGELLSGFSADEVEAVMKFLRQVIERAPSLGSGLAAAKAGRGSGSEGSNDDGSSDDGSSDGDGSSDEPALARAAAARRGSPARSASSPSGPSGPSGPSSPSNPFSASSPSGAPGRTQKKRGTTT